VKDNPLQWQVAIIGAGNVAWHLGHALAKAGIRISQVISRSKPAAQILAESLNTRYSLSFEDFLPENDCSILCVSDNALPVIAERIKFGDCLALHTAGSIPAEVLKGWAKNYGVLYPLQTITKKRALDLWQIPLLVEANNEDNLILVKKLASLVSGYIVQAGSEQRMNLHLAAVFAGNFSNHMYALAEKILIQQGLSFELLKPLIAETAAKVLEIPPHLAQTGPAVRGDNRIMMKHMALLETYPGFAELYMLISRSIMNLKPDQKG
jgi:predicted short-subunit dehydrogenase-like oxidoreductase (DUF2520 family)